MAYWQRNLYVLWFGMFLSAASWTMVIPFLPLGMAENLEFWSGLIFASQFIGSTVMAPIWGSLADRYGRKMMIVRAGAGISFVFALMATNTPEERVGSSLGILQTGQASGAIMGPLLGGVLADLLGIRGAFLTGSALQAVATVLAIIWVKEVNRRSGGPQGSILRDLSTAFHMPVLVGVVSTMAIANMGMMALQPVLPLLIAARTQGAANWVSCLIFSMG